MNNEQLQQLAEEKAKAAYQPMAIGGTDNIYVTGKKKGAFARGYISGYTDAMKWVSVEDAPLFTKEGNMWTATIPEGQEFIAALQYNDKTKPGRSFWWIRLCVITDLGLCVVEEDDVVPAGWDMADVTHYKLIEPPKQ